MKTLLILLTLAATAFSQTLTKDFQVIQTLPSGVIVQEVVIRYVSSAELIPKEIRSPGYSMGEFEHSNVITRQDGSIYIVPPMNSVGGSASRMGKVRPVITSDQYFIARDNSNILFKKDHRFKARYNTVKTLEKEGKKIDLIKVQAYTAFIDTSIKKPAVAPSRLVPSGSKYSKVKSSPRN